MGIANTGPRTGNEAEPEEGASRDLGSEFAGRFAELCVPVQTVRPERPAILALNEPLARELNLDPRWLRTEAGTRFLLGNELPKDATPVAQVYSGHQFGAYSPRLGDGRAALLGELTDRDGHLRDMHLKGSGPTPFTRADGFATVGSMLREYVMGEAMHALGIATTRALAVVATGRSHMRDESIDTLPGAVLVRIASSHLRVGTFQFARSTGDADLLRRLADYAIERHYPELLRVGAKRTQADLQPALAATQVVDACPYLGLLSAVIEAQAKLTASWMLVGFVHGVMNTDNVTISGETIDYGPCAFLDAYDAAAVFSSIDQAGRYAYGRQPAITHFNLTRFAEALLPLLADEPEQAKTLALEALAEYGPAYDRAWLAGMRKKLGVSHLSPSDFSDKDLTALAAEIFGDLQTHRVDYTRFFRALAESVRASEKMLGLGGSFDDELQDREALRELRALFEVVGVQGENRWQADWFDKWRSLSPNPDAMDQVNPVYIARNAALDEALDSASDGDLTDFWWAVDAVTNPFDRRPGLERFELSGDAGVRRHITYCGT